MEENRQERWMGLDVGRKRIGIALTDSLCLTAAPHSTLQRSTLEHDANQLLALARSRKVTRLVVGLPRHLDGSSSSTERWIRPLVRHLTQISDLKICWSDERLSTREAERLLAERRIPPRQRRQRRDEFAAALILQWYLEDLHS